MKHKRHLVVLDPVPFFGGSKLATENILRQLEREDIRISLLTADQDSWGWSHFRYLSLFEPNWLSRQIHGIPYFIRHICIAIQLIITRFKTGPIDLAIGASGPGVDMALYFAQPFLNYKIIQLVHGPVANSKIIGRCLMRADEIHHLASSKSSLLLAMRKASKLSASDKLHVMVNGIPLKSWPSPCQMNRPVIFWASSLMPWKRIDVLIDALSLLADNDRCQTHICFIRPKNTAYADFRTLEHDFIHWHEKPADLDSIRANANIFVSTSDKEPFGLSILEAMAAGHCVLIPADGAYWDLVLKHNTHCVKYPANNPEALSQTLVELIHNMPRVRSIGHIAATKAREYEASHCYASLKSSLLGAGHQHAETLPIDKELKK